MSVIDNALRALFNMVFKPTLWENASPTSEFAEQKIPIDLSGYKSVTIPFGFSSAGVRRIGDITVEIGEGGNANTGYIGTEGNSNYLARRYFTVDETGVTFEGATRKYTTNTAEPTENDAYVIPIKIIGNK